MSNSDWQSYSTNKTNEEMATINPSSIERTTKIKPAIISKIRKLRNLIDDLECECPNKERLIKDLKIDKER